MLCNISKEADKIVLFCVGDLEQTEKQIYTYLKGTYTKIYVTWENYFTARDASKRKWKD